MSSTMSLERSRFRDCSCTCESERSETPRRISTRSAPSSPSFPDKISAPLACSALRSSPRAPPTPRRRTRRPSIVRNQLGRRNEVVQVPADDLLDHDVGMFFLRDIGVEVVLPEIDRTAEVLGQKRHEPRDERITEDYGAR